MQNVSLWHIANNNVWVLPFPSSLMSLNCWKRKGQKKIPHMIKETLLTYYENTGNIIQVLNVSYVLLEKNSGRVTCMDVAAERAFRYR